MSLLSVNVMGDATVSAQSTHILAANIGAVLLEPAVTPLYLVPGQISPIANERSKVMFQILSTRDFEKIAKNSAIPGIFKIVQFLSSTLKSYLSILFSSL